MNATRATSHEWTIAGLQVEVVRKDVKNLHIGVYPPHGLVRVAAPLAMTDAAVHVAIVSRLPWIRRQRAAFLSQERESPREMVSGETHYVFGRRMRLRVEPAKGNTRISVTGRNTLLMRVAPDRPAAARLAALHRWYRAELRKVLTPLVDEWAERMGVTPAGWRIQRMKTRWGSCSPSTARLLFNLELAKKPPACIEYIVVHELAHLLVPTHNERFVAIMDEFVPNWRVLRKELNSGVLGV
jgi:hypothetical protein